MLDNTRCCHKCSCHFASMPSTLLFTAILPASQHLIEYIYSWVWRSQLDAKEDVADHVGNVCQNECPKFESLDFLKHESLDFHSHTHEVM